MRRNYSDALFFKLILSAKWGRDARKNTILAWGQNWSVLYCWRFDFQTLTCFQHLRRKPVVSHIQKRMQMYFHSLSRSSLSDFSKATQQITRRVTIRLLVCPTLSSGAPGFPAWGCSPLELFLVSAEGEGSSPEEGRAPLLIGEENKRKEGTVNHAVISKWLYSLHIVCTHASSK